MRILGKKIPLGGGGCDYNFAFEIDEDTVPVSIADFSNWCEGIGAGERFKIGTYYTPEIFGDVNHNAVLIKKYTTKKFITALLLQWA